MKVNQRPARKDSQGLLREEVYAQIKRDIITGELSQGGLLNEGGLAERFGTSKTPVREALTRLQQTSLVERIPHKGFLVTPVAVSDMREIFEMRLILERSAAELAAHRITEEQLEHLEQYREITVAKHDREAIYQATQANRDFHIGIARSTRNSRLVAALERIFDDAQRLQFVDLIMRGGIDAWPVDHGRIIDALRARDPNEAGEAVEEGLRKTRRRMLGQ